jgi:putative ABC transport system permease protein
MELQISEEVEKYGPNIVVTPDTKSIFQANQLEKLTSIPNAKNIRIISPKLFLQAQSAEQTLLVAGLNFESELYLKVWWDINGNMPKDSYNEALLGSVVLEVLELSVGSVFELNGAKFTVSGYLSETGSNDDYTVFIPLFSAQNLAKLPGEISLVDIGALCTDCPVEDISNQIMAAIPGIKATPILQAVETRMQTVEKASKFSLMLAFVVLMAGCIGVMNTMVSSIHQRKREIGVLMSLGADNIFVYKIFLFEALLLGIVGGIIGSCLGVIISVILGPVMTSTSTSLGSIPIFVFPLSMGVSIFTCLLASIHPTWRATKIDPVIALKAI